MHLDLPSGPSYGRGVPRAYAGTRCRYCIPRHAMGMHRWYPHRVQKKAGNELVFVVRMRVPRGSHPENGFWRGFIQEVDSGRRFYVVNAHDVIDFLGTQIAEASRRYAEDKGEP